MDDYVLAGCVEERGLQGGEGGEKKEGCIYRDKQSVQIVGGVGLGSQWLH